MKVTSLNRILRHTKSVCPVCLTGLSAQIVKTGKVYSIKKTCPEHGPFSAVIWRGEAPSLEAWDSYQPPMDGGVPGCPTNCGLCPGHLRQTCCALVEVTARCNLRCPVCFAAAEGPAAHSSVQEPTVEALYTVFKQLADGGNTFVQLSGGEPTVRHDLPEIVAAARRAGCDTVQLNSNGLRLGAEPGFAKALKDAGLSFVFLQFDGTEDAIYTTLRGRPMLQEKLKAIEVCRALNLGVTLVPTVVPGVNDGNIGALLRFGLRESPAVRGVHFQPISYFGRYPAPPADRDRITLPELLHAITTQTDGQFSIQDFAPSCCDHPRCGFHGDFIVLPNTVLKLTRQKETAPCCGEKDAHLKNRRFVARRWTRTDDSTTYAADADYTDMDTFLQRARTHGFTISAMAFQDAYTLDLERLRSCSLHVVTSGRVVPFCANYLTAHL